MPPGIILLPACHPGDERPRLGPALFRPPQCPLKAVGMPVGQTGARHWEGGLLVLWRWPKGPPGSALATFPRPHCHDLALSDMPVGNVGQGVPGHKEHASVSPPVLPVETENVRKQDSSPPAPRLCSVSLREDKGPRRSRPSRPLCNLYSWGYHHGLVVSTEAPARTGVPTLVPAVFWPGLLGAGGSLRHHCALAGTPLT